MLFQRGKGLCFEKKKKKKTKKESVNQSRRAKKKRRVCFQKVSEGMSINENVLDATAAAVLAGARFLSDYHTSVQTNRERLLDVFRDTSVMLWNGTKITGVAAIVALINSLPVCTTRTASVDVQVLRCECLLSPFCNELSFSRFGCFLDGQSGRDNRDDRDHQQREHQLRGEQPALLHRVAGRRAPCADQRVCGAHGTLPSRLVSDAAVSFVVLCHPFPPFPFHSSLLMCHCTLDNHTHARTHKAKTDCKEE